jgi:hypothetical protein
VGKPEGKRHWEDQDVGGWTILKWILESYDGIDLRKIGWDIVDLIDMAQDRD